MSSYETHKGKIKLVAEGESATRTFLSKIIDDQESVFDPDYGVYELIWDNGLEKKYSYFNESLYEWVEHKVKYDEEDDYCIISKNSDGTYNINAQFYNGGQYLDEILEWEFKKFNDKGLTNAELIDVACKWLDYHHSNYINEDLFGKLIVNGGCQTDLRAFLNTAKNMDYWDAIDAAKNNK